MQNEGFKKKKKKGEKNRLAESSAGVCLHLDFLFAYFILFFGFSFTVLKDNNEKLIIIIIINIIML